MDKAGISFEIKDLDVAGRIGQFKIGQKTLETPALFPVVSPFENAIPPRKIYEHFRFHSIFTNAYIIYQKRERNPQFLEKGLHKVLDYPGIIATDSGGFQDYMYGGDLKISPEEIEPFQEQLGSDCPVILDIPVQITDSYETAKSKVDITLDRARNNVTRRKRDNCAWFGPIHGSIFPDLLERSSKEMSNLDFGIYAIGGVVKTFIDYRFDLDVKVLLQVKRWINPHRPLHMFGLGLPSFFALAVACGADTFDSAAYYLYAKDNRYFTLQGTKSLDEFTEFPCHCPICMKYNPKELMKAPPSERISALAEHNLYVSSGEIATIRQAIREGTLWDLVEQRVMAHPKLIKALRTTRDYLPLIESLSVNEKTHGFKYLSENSFYRPEIYRYLQRIREFRFDPRTKRLIILPELDLPALSNQMLKSWVDSLQKEGLLSETEIVILSNLFGPIPLSLNEMYPLSHHEGYPDHRVPTRITETLLAVSELLIKNHEKVLEKVHIFLPESFQNEYGEDEPFPLENHLISHYIAMMQKKFSSIHSTISKNLSDLIAVVQK